MFLWFSHRLIVCVCFFSVMLIRWIVAVPNKFACHQCIIGLSTQLQCHFTQIFHWILELQLEQKDPQWGFFFYTYIGACSITVLHSFSSSNNEKTLVLNCQQNNNKKDVFYHPHYKCCFNIYSLVDNLTLWLRLTFPRINASLKYLYIFISNV